MQILLNMLFKHQLVLLLVISSLVVGVSQNTYISNKIDKSLIENYSKVNTQEYILLFRSKATFGRNIKNWTKSQKSNYVFKTLKNHAEVTQKPIISWLNQKNITYQSFYVANAIKVTSQIDVMMELASRDDVQYIIDNKPFYMLDYEESRPISLRTGTPEWGLLNIKADSVWKMGIRGQNVTIAGQDTGYEWELSPIKNKYRGYINDSTAIHDFNWHDAIHINNPAIADTLLNPCGFSSRQPCDDHNHGTHTMGTMVGQDEDNTIGVAPEAQWIACRNMDRGWGQPSTYMECFEWFLAPYDYEKEIYNPDLAPHVINNSWYCSEGEGCNPSNFYIMETIVNNLKTAGIVVVASAGNSGRNGCGSVSGPPAFFENSFSIGATDINDTIGNFSSIGPVTVDGSFRLKPDVTAPGVRVRSIVRGGQYRTWNGTSMAGPHVAGVVALMISANPRLAGQVDIIEDIIRETARPQKTELDCDYFNDPLATANPVYGHGIVNAYEAVKKAIDFIPSHTEDKISQVSIYPNPTESHITVRLDDAHSTLKSISIYNLQGQKLYQQNYIQASVYEIIDVHSLPQGAYIIEVHTSSGNWINKFIKTE